MNELKRMWYIQTREYYSAMRKEDILSSVTTWMDLENMMLCDISQRKTSIGCYHLYIKPVKNSKMVVTRGWGFSRVGGGDCYC